MRYPACEKIEIIRLVEQSSLSVRRTLEQIGVPRATFYRWYDLYQTVRRQKFWDSRAADLVEGWPRLGLRFRRRFCGAASADVRGSGG